MANVVQAKRGYRKKPIKVPRPGDDETPEQRHARQSPAARDSTGRRRTKDDAEVTSTTRPGAEKGPVTVHGIKGMLGLYREATGLPPLPST